MYRLWIAAGSLAGLTAVAMAAAAAHALGGMPPPAMRALQAGLQMHEFHALALVATGLWAERRPGWLVNLAGAAFLSGLLAFCGAVYGAALGDWHTGPLPATGGFAFMLGWACLAAAALRR